MANAPMTDCRVPSEQESAVAHGMSMPTTLRRFAEPASNSDHAGYSVGTTRGKREIRADRPMRGRG